MSDMEIMAAIGSVHQLGEEILTMTKPKKSFMQKLAERHEALKLQLRSPKVDEFNDEEDSAPSRTSSSSSSHKDFFKLAPVAWSIKSDRSKSEFAILYDDIASNSAPSPVFVQLPSPPPSSTPTEVDSKIDDQDSFAHCQQKPNREASASDFLASPSLHSSNSNMSMKSARLPTPTTTRPPLLTGRTRSLPSKMSDEQMDAWLDKPEDAELHRRRKHSALSEYSPTMSQRYVQRRKMTAKAREISAHPVLHKNCSSFSERDFLQREFENRLNAASDNKPLMLLRQQAPTGNKVQALTLNAMPVEIVLDVARYLDTQSAARCRQTCRKLRDTVPAPCRPLAPRKT